MTAAKSCGGGWWISVWWCARITSRAFRKCRRPLITCFAKLWRYWPVSKFELFGTLSCPYTQEMREWLEWRGYEYVEYDVETDAEARARMVAISGGQRTVPILAEDGDV